MASVKSAKQNHHPVTLSKDDAKPSDVSLLAINTKKHIVPEDKKILWSHFSFISLVQQYLIINLLFSYENMTNHIKDE